MGFKIVSAEEGKAGYVIARGNRDSGKPPLEDMPNGRKYGAVRLGLEQSPVRVEISDIRVDGNELQPALSP